MCATRPPRPLTADTAPCPPAPSALRRPPIKGEGKSQRRHRHLRLCALPRRPSKYQAVSPRAPTLHRRCHAPFTPTSSPPPSAYVGKGKPGGAAGQSRGPCAGRRDAGTHLYKSWAAPPQGCNPHPRLSWGHCHPLHWVQCHRTQLTPKGHRRELGSGETEAALGSSHGDMGHRKRTLHLGGHFTGQHQGTGKGKHPLCQPGGMRGWWHRTFAGNTASTPSSVVGSGVADGGTCLE